MINQQTMTTLTSVKSDIVVETQYGKVRGAAHNDLTIWKGIPYARPPAGELRFRPPQSPASWAGVRDALEFGVTAPQLPGVMGNLFGAARLPYGEDCLTLNVWSPAADDARRPVLVWIHGGSFLTGSGATPWYDGAAFASHGDIVVVTINYRLGALGFLHLADLADERFASSGLCGILDQVKALEWVRDNIAAFGGDPQNVTVVGESAGAMSIGTLLGLPAARGLFQKAILQSGACHHITDRARATAVAERFMAALELERSQSAALLDLPLDRLLEAQAKLITPGGGLAFQPVVDGASLPQRPLDAVADGSASGVALLVGTNLDEMKLFTAMDPNRAAPNDQALEQIFGAQRADAVAAYTQSRPGKSPSDVWVDILTDQVFRIPAIRLAERQLRHGAPVWMYRFDWPTPAFGGIFGSCHALEIPFVFNNLNKPGAEMFTGDSPARQPLAERMHAAWIAFVRDGNPQTPDLPGWPAYDLARRATLIFNETCGLEDDPQSAERRVWDGLL